MGDDASSQKAKNMLREFHATLMEEVSELLISFIYKHNRNRCDLNKSQVTTLLPGGRMITELISKKHCHKKMNSASVIKPSFITSLVKEYAMSTWKTR